MGKYLHHYTSEDDFQKDYYSEGEKEVTAITVQMAVIYDNCTEGPVDPDSHETSEYNGKYVFDHEADFPPVTLCNELPVPEHSFLGLKVFKNGNKEIFAFKMMVSEDEAAWSYETEGGEMAYIIQDFSSLGQAGDGVAMISSVEYGEETVGGYKEPWVSYTEAETVPAYVDSYVVGPVNQMTHSRADGVFRLEYQGKVEVTFSDVV
jgi:hypothetical protein